MADISGHELASLLETARGLCSEAGALSRIFEIDNLPAQQDFLAAAPGIYLQLLAAKLNGR